MKTRYKLSIFLFLLLFSAMSLLGCATPERKELDVSKLVWPKEPDPARVRFIRHIRSDVSLRALTQNERLFGMQPAYIFRKPADVAVDKRGTAYVADLAQGFVASFNLDDLSASRLHLPGQANPLGIGYNEKLDWLVVVSPVGRNIKVYQLPELKEILFIDDQNGVELVNPVDAAIDAERGRIYVTDSKRGYIRVYNLEGKYTHDIGNPGRGPEDLFSPTFITLDKDGNIYVVEVFNFRFHVYTPDGKTLTTIGEHGTFVGSFARPKGIALDQDGLIYVSDAAFGNVQIFDLKGNVYLFFGSNGKELGKFQIPEGMFIDHQNRLYVADQRNSRVQVFQIYSDKYYEEHPEEAAKFENPAVTILPEDEEAEGAQDMGEEPMMEDEKPSEDGFEVIPMDEEPMMEEAQPSDEGAEMAPMEEAPMMEEEQPSDGGSDVAPIEEDPRFEEEAVEPAPEEQ